MDKELTTWHIQCVYQRLETIEEIANYIKEANTFITRIWQGPRKDVPVPPKLRVDAVENLTITYRGASTNAVRLRFKLTPSRYGETDTFYNAISHFCKRVFHLKTEGEIQSKISLITSRSILGIAPLSQWFRFCWTQSFLDTFVYKQVPLFNEVADGDFSFSWLRGVAFLVVTSEKRASNTLGAIKTALAQSLAFETRRPDKELEAQGKRDSEAFIRCVEKLLRYLEATGDKCASQLDQGSDHLPLDFELQLFDVVLEVLEKGFDVLTTNKQVFDMWQEIISGAADKVDNACFISGTSLAVFAFEVYRVGTAAGAAATAATAGAAATAAGGTACSAMCTVAVLGPLGLLVASTGIWLIHRHYYDKVTKESAKIKKLSEKIRGHYEAATSLAQWLVKFCDPSPASNMEGGQEMQMLQAGAKLSERGLKPVLTLRDFQASIESEADVLREELRKMREDPELKDLFP
ncbi:hypothetical protein ACHAPT_013106 [Fusarium lateritium]